MLSSKIKNQYKREFIFVVFRYPKKRFTQSHKRLQPLPACALYYAVQKSWCHACARLWLCGRKCMLMYFYVVHVALIIKFVRFFLNLVLFFTGRMVLPQVWFHALKTRLWKFNSLTHEWFLFVTIYTFFMP